MAAVPRCGQKLDDSANDAALGNADEASVTLQSTSRLLNFALFFVRGAGWARLEEFVGLEPSRALPSAVSIRVTRMAHIMA